MTDLFMIVIFLLTGICGWWVMGRVDHFLNEYVKGEEGEGEEEDEQRYR